MTTTGGIAKQKRQLKNITKYDSIPPLTATGKTLESWTDDDILIDNSLPLTVLDQEMACLTVKSVLEDLTSSVSEITAYNVLLLTWNMRSETYASKRIFPSTTPGMSVGKVSELSTLKSVPEGSVHVIEIPVKSSDKDEMIRQGCYVAASLLKLFTKEHSSWMKAQSHLAENYKKFTDKEFILASVPMFESSVSSLRRTFQTHGIFKNTLGMILWSVNDLTKGRGMTQMLFEQHLSFTGLHIIGLFCKACVGLHTSPSYLLRALHTSAFEGTLDQLALIIKDYMGSKDPSRDKETYKYARLYDASMFSLLQTKNCPEIVCILGHIGMACGNSGTGNVMDIAAISQMSEQAKSVYQKVAENIFSYFKVELPEQKITPSISSFRGGNS